MERSPDLGKIEDTIILRLKSIKEPERRCSPAVVRARQNKEPKQRLAIQAKIEC
jgi:hypothetical protein